jgi:uncharacterized Zn-finger protein
VCWERRLRMSTRKCTAHVGVGACPSSHMNQRSEGSEPRMACETAPDAAPAAALLVRIMQAAAAASAAPPVVPVVVPAAAPGAADPVTATSRIHPRDDGSREAQFPASDTAPPTRRRTGAEDIRPRPYVCDVCEKRFVEPSYLQRHRRVHTREYPHVCEHADCSRRFKHWSSLKVHHCMSANARVSEHRCTVAGCERSFSSAANLAQHLQRHLPRIAEFACRQCGQLFNDRSNRSAHERRHLVADVAAARPYPCPQPACGMAFTQAGHLRSHQSSAHAAERPRDYRCTFEGCDKAYLEAGSLRWHRRTQGHHVEARPRLITVDNASLRQSVPPASPEAPASLPRPLAQQ